MSFSIGSTSPGMGPHGFLRRFGTEKDGRLFDRRVVTRIVKLREDLNYHLYRYHTLDAPVISDYEYDQLFHQLKALEEAHHCWRLFDYAGH